MEGVLAEVVISELEILIFEWQTRYLNVLWKSEKQQIKTLDKKNVTLIHRCHCSLHYSKPSTECVNGVIITNMSYSVWQQWMSKAG